MLLIASIGPLVVERGGDCSPPVPFTRYDFEASAARCFRISGRLPWNHALVLSSLPPLTVQTSTQPPPSWSAAVISIGGTRPPRVKPLIFSMPFLTSSEVGIAPPLALMALRRASTCSAAISTPRL